MIEKYLFHKKVLLIDLIVYAAAAAFFGYIIGVYVGGLPI